MTSSAKVVQKINIYQMHEDPSKTLIFIHIPKTAGSSFRQVLKRPYKKNTVHEIYGQYMLSVNEFKELSESEKLRIRLLIGHMPFGLDEFLPQPSTYITILREPLDRIVSHYYYILRSPRHPIHNQVVEENMGLCDYALSGLAPMELDNGQVRFISGVSGQKIKYGDCSVDLLEIAKDNLRKKFAVVGLSEYFSETLILFKKVFGWKNMFYVKDNVTKDRPRLDDFSPEIIEAIRQHNRFDVALYEFAEKEFKRQLQQVGVYKSEVRNFEKFNKIYQDASFFWSSTQRFAKARIKKAIGRTK